MVLRAKVLPQRASSHHGALVGDHRTRRPPQPFPFSLNQFKMGSPIGKSKVPKPCISDLSTDLDSHPVNVIIIRLSLCTIPYTSSTSANLTLASLLRLLARFRSLAETFLPSSSAVAHLLQICTPCPFSSSSLYADCK